MDVNKLYKIIFYITLLILYVIYIYITNFQYKYFYLILSIIIPSISNNDTLFLEHYNLE